MTLPLRAWLAHAHHRLIHWLDWEPCELLEVRDGGRVLVLRCTECGEVLTLEAEP